MHNMRSWTESLQINQCKSFVFASNLYDLYPLILTKPLWFWPCFLDESDKTPIESDQSLSASQMNTDEGANANQHMEV